MTLPSVQFTAVMLVHDDRIDRRVLDEARSLTEAGWHVTVIAAPSPARGDRQDETAYPEVEIVRVRPDIAPDPVPAHPAFELLQAIAWRDLFYYHDHFLAEALKRPATVYVAHDLPQLLAARMAAIYHQAYLVYDAHELYPDQGLFIENGQTPILAEIERWLVPQADQVITVNKSIAELMAIRYKIPLPEVILNCPALHHHKSLPIPRSNILRQELGIPDHHCLLLYQGIYALTRNLQGVIRAMKSVRNSNVVFVLMGPGLHQENELTRLAQELGLLNRRVFFRAAVPQTDLLSYTASADAGIIPYQSTELNNYYCTPNKLFEFMVAGVPILANDLPELNRFVTQQNIGLNLPLTTPEAIADAIDLFFSHDIAALRACAQSVSPLYVWNTQGEKLIAIFNRLLGQPAQAATASVVLRPPAALMPASNVVLPSETRLAEIETAAMLQELKRRLGRRFISRVRRIPVVVRPAKWLYRRVIRPLAIRMLKWLEKGG